MKAGRKAGQRVSKYRFTKTSKSYVRYHSVFCTRRRRGILQMDGVGARFKELLLQIYAMFLLPIGPMSRLTASSRIYHM